MEFQQANGHHGEVRHHVVLFQERAHGSQHLRRIAVSGMHHLVESKLGFIAPMPSVLEGFNLGARFLAGGATKQNVVRGLTVEWRIEVNQIHALIVNAAAQNVEIVAVVKPIHRSLFGGFADQD
jgi:hypothetical protein